MKITIYRLKKDAKFLGRHDKTDRRPVQALKKNVDSSTVIQIARAIKLTEHPFPEENRFAHKHMRQKTHIPKVYKQLKQICTLILIIGRCIRDEILPILSCKLQSSSFIHE